MCSVCFDKGQNSGWCKTITANTLTWPMGKLRWNQGRNGHEKTPQNLGETSRFCDRDDYCDSYSDSGKKRLSDHYPDNSVRTSLCYLGTGVFILSL